MRNPRLRLLPALISTLLLAGCRGPAPSPQRLIEEEPAEIFSTTLVARYKVIFRWPLASQSDLADWQIQKADRVIPLDDGGVVLRGPRVDISREVDLPTARIDALEVDLLPLRSQGGNLMLSWAPGRAPFRSKRQLSATTPPTSPSAAP